jgi:hypothetical protein
VVLGQLAAANAGWVIPAETSKAIATAAAAAIMRFMVTKVPPWRALTAPCAGEPTGYSFTTPVWDGGTWVTPAVAEVWAAPKANGPEDQPRNAPAQWDKID